MASIMALEVPVIGLEVAVAAVAPLLEGTAFVPCLGLCGTAGPKDRRTEGPAPKEIESGIPSRPKRDGERHPLQSRPAPPPPPTAPPRPRGKSLVSSPLARAPSSLSLPPSLPPSARDSRHVTFFLTDTLESPGFTTCDVFLTDTLESPGGWKGEPGSTFYLDVVGCLRI